MIVGLLLALLASTPARAEPTGKVVVLVVVDQLGAVYMTRYQSLFKGGLARLSERGACYPNMRFEYANTETAPGHATIATGTWPNTHGVIANSWIDPVTLKKTKSIDDEAFGQSPVNLRAGTVSDRLTLTTRGRGKTVSLSIKDRAAILSGGNTATAVWFDKARVAFVSGTWRNIPPPEWLVTFNAEGRPQKAWGKVWDRLRKDLDYAAIAGPDADPTETHLPGLTTTFPKKLGEGLTEIKPEDYESWVNTPDSLENLLELSRRAIKGERLGQRGVSDHLIISISALDYVGHYFGPASQEALDILLRIDRELGVYMDDVEKLVGSAAVTWVLTADHGMGDTSEQSAALGVRAQRVDPRTLIEPINNGLAQYEGTPSKKTVPIATVLDVNHPSIYLAYRSGVRDKTPIRRRAAEILRGLPSMLDAVAVDDIDRLPEPMRTFFTRSLAPGREPDLVFVHRPHDLIAGVGPSGHGFGSNHATPYVYDMAVPVFVMGPGITPATDRKPYPMTRVAPTLSVLLGIDPPASAYDGPLPVVENRRHSH